MPCTALADTDDLEPSEVLEDIQEDIDLEESDDVLFLDVDEDWPEDAIEDTLEVRHSDESLLFAVKLDRGGVAVKSVSASPTGAAWTVFQQIITTAYNRAQANDAFIKDLAWRWYHADSTKRAKIPVIPSNDSRFATLTTESFTGAGDAQAQYAAFERYYQQFWPLIHAYNLVKFDGGIWTPSGSVNDIASYQEYAKWYDWFEGTNSSGGGQIVPTENSITLVLKKYKSSSVSAFTYYTYDSFDTETLDYTATDELNRYSFSYKDGTAGSYNYVFPPENALLYYSEAVKTWLSTQSSNDKKVFVYINNGSMNVYTCTNYEVTYEEQTQNDITYNNPVSVTFSNDAKKWTYTTSNNGQTQNKSSAGVYNDGIVYRWNTAPSGSGSTQSTTLSLYQGWVSGAIQGGGGTVEPSNPVYPNYPQPTVPQQPNVTYNNPTYNSYTINETTTTTTDLTPILNAIRILNDNVQTGFDNMAESLDTHFDNLHRMLEAWFTDFSNWLELIYEELQQVNRYLEGIYFNTSGNDEAPIYPDLDDGNTIEQQTDVNLELLKKKFPTSIPWDLYGILTLLETAPVAPSFTLPVVMTEYTITIDLSDFSPMAAVSRRMSVLLFAVGLLMNTKRIASIDIGANHDS